MGLPSIQSVVNDLEDSIQAPRALIFSAVLSSISLSLQGLVDVRKPSGGVSPCSLMLLSIAESGDRKSTVDKVALKAVRDIQCEQDIEYERLVSRWKIQHKVWGIQQRTAQKRIEKAAIKCEETLELEVRYAEVLGFEPVHPRRFKLLYEDSSSEALFRGLYQNYPSAGVVSSEGGGALKGAALNDFSKQNALWSGDGVYVDRISREGFTLNNARLTVSLMVQPGVFEDYMSKRGGLSKSSGYWARFLVCSPESIQGNRDFDISDNFAESVNVEVLYRVISGFVGLNVGKLVGEDFSRSVLEFDDQAKLEWIAFSRFVEAHIADGGFWSSMKDHASKLADNVARLAALFHCFENGCVEGKISKEMMVAAINLGLWYSGEYAKIFSRDGRLESDARTLISWMLSKTTTGGSSFPKGYILKYGPSRLRKKSDLDEIIVYLQSKGFIGVDCSGRKEIIMFNPPGRVRGIGAWAGAGGLGAFGMGPLYI